MKSRWIIWPVIVVAALAVAVYLDPTCVLLGSLRNESFFEGRPTTWWENSLGDGRERTRSQALERLRDGRVQALPVLIELLTHTAASDWSAGQIRANAANLIGRLGPEAGSAVPGLIQALKDPDPYVRLSASSALGAVGRAEQEAVAALIEMLERIPERAKVIRALSSFRGAAGPAVMKLVELLHDPEELVRWEAARTLGKIGAPAESAVPALIDLLADPMASVREHAAESLGEIGLDAGGTIAALQKTLTDPEPRVRRDAARSLGQFGARAREALPDLAKLQQDPDKGVRDAAAESVRQIQHKAASNPGPAAPG